MSIVSASRPRMPRPIHWSMLVMGYKAVGGSGSRTRRMVLSWAVEQTLWVWLHIPRPRLAMRQLHHCRAWVLNRQRRRGRGSGMG